MKILLHRLAAIVAPVVVVTATTAIAFERFDLRIALTDSATPAGIYQMRPLSSLSRGELVAACLPSGIARFAISRDYLSVSPISECQERAAPIGKLVLALPGDEIEITPDFVSINGQRFAHSATVPNDSNGRRLPRVSAGEYRVQAGSAWLFGFNDANSFDSRYYGPLPLSAIKSVAVPLLTW
jgi:conjugative transfer signal peptidase TraF